MKETITYVFNNSWESFKDYMKPTRPNFEMSLPFKFWNNLGNVPFNKTYLKTETSQSQECLGQATITHTKAESQMTEVIEMHVFEIFWCPRCSPKTIKIFFFFKYLQPKLFRNQHQIQGYKGENFKKYLRHKLGPGTM